MRRAQFTVNAESVQGNVGAEATFRCLKVREWREWRDDPASTDEDLLKAHLVGWQGFQGDAGADLPSPADEPAIVGELYIHEQRELVRLLLQGPDGENAKN